MASDLAQDLLATLNKKATSTKGYLQGDHAQHTWGLEIPHLAFQWLIGGANVLPAQRYFGISGEEKSYKSTLDVEIGTWFMRAGGVHIKLDTENKTSPYMLDAMTWWREGIDPGRRLFKVCSSIAEWQDMVTTAVEGMRKRGPQPKGERQALFISIDSLTGRGTADADKALRKEGHAAERGFPVASLQTTNYLETLNLLGTTVSVAWVQHMKQSMDQTGYGVQFKEKGAKAAQFSCSTHLRVSKAKTLSYQSHDSAPFEGSTVNGHEIYMKSVRSCLGPDQRTVMVPLLWQYVKPEGTTEHRQVMWFDWDGALGELLIGMQYNDKFKPKLFTQDKERLKNAVNFTEKRANSIYCEELGLENASRAAFGKAIRENIDVYDKVRDFLHISEFPTIQQADIDFNAGTLKA